MTTVDTDDGRARQRELVRRGYDAVSLTYRSDGVIVSPSRVSIGGRSAPTEF